MLGRIFTMSLAAVAMAFNGYAAEPAGIKVLILHDQPGALLETQGKYKLVDPHTGTGIAPYVRYVGKVKYVQPMKEGLKWGEEFPGIFQLEVIPAASDTAIYVNGNQYEGNIYLYDIGGSLSAVNELDLESYLSALLASKYPADLPEEVLAALAIVERTNAYYYATKPKTPYWSVDGSQVGFSGFVNPNSDSPIQKALRATKAMVLSRTGTYEGVVTPFPAEWNLAKKDSGIGTPKMGTSLISLSEAKAMSDKGDHAASILGKAFPKTTIQLIPQ